MLGGDETQLRTCDVDQSPLPYSNGIEIVEIVEMSEIVEVEK